MASRKDKKPKTAPPAAESDVVYPELIEPDEPLDVEPDPAELADEEAPADVALPPAEDEPEPAPAPARAAALEPASRSLQRIDPLTVYINQIRRYSLLSREEDH